MKARLAAPLITLCLAAVLAPTSSSATTTYHDYVALGDSWSADIFTTIPPTVVYVPISCAQSISDYPHQIAHALHVTRFRDATCTGATTADMAAPQTFTFDRPNPAQFGRLTATTDLVTLGIGANDIGLMHTVVSCFSMLPTGSRCAAKLTASGTDRLAQAIAATAPKLTTVIAGIRARSPHARILLVNYLNGFPASGKSCWPAVPITNTDMAYLQAKFVQMNAMLASVAHATRVRLVDTYTPTLGHDVCKPSSVRYVGGMVPLSSVNHGGVAVPFHPNQAGANAQARIVLSAIMS